MGALANMADHHCFNLTGSIHSLLNLVSKAHLSRPKKHQNVLFRRGPRFLTHSQLFLAKIMQSQGCSEIARCSSCGELALKLLQPDPTRPSGVVVLVKQIEASNPL